MKRFILEVIVLVAVVSVVVVAQDDSVIPLPATEAPIVVESPPAPDTYIIHTCDESMLLAQTALEVLTGESSSKVDINTATVDQIAQIPRTVVGEDLAQTFAEAAAEENFTSWEDVRRRLKGVGAVTISVMQRYAEIK